MTGRAIALASALAVLFGRCAQSTDHGDHGDHGAHGGGPAASGAPADHAAHAPGAPSGYAPITIAPERVGPLGLTTATVAERDFTRVLRTVGVVTFDETRTAHVHTKVRGFIEGLPAGYVGKLVRAGEPLAAIYSQEVYAAQLEYLSLLEPPQVASGESITLGDAGMWQGTAEASRRRLLLWDVPKRQIEQLEKTRKASRTYTIFAPRSGTLVTKQAVIGNFVEPGSELFTISELGLLWVLVDVYEDDVRHVKLGQQTKLTVQGQPEPLTAKIAFVAPTIEETTRTLKVRLELPNPDGALKPGAFATAEIELPLGRGLAVPESAVLRTGTRAIVFVIATHGPGAAPGEALHVEPREVSVGALIGGHYRVASGLALGDRVATGAQFLIDSESRLKASSAGGGGQGGHGGH
ncbi:MAG: efflux RND transporter periplasmic adaptor subunit [Deltaproteobacteria bacterium]|nr:efflux RND transporter periplasmic adaptor subunit [Deltaproteobacteria bacterium]